MLRKWMVLLTMSCMIGLIGCSNEETSLSDEEVKTMIHEYSTDQLEATSASVNANQLIVEKDNETMAYDLPEEEFFLSIAPFQNATHPCTYHSLTGCQSELTDTTFDVYIEDADGNIIVNKEMTSFNNGFIDIWLPRNEKFYVTISYQDKEAKAELSTFDDDPTCITTMQLL
jgi:hypothetical protein